MYKRTERENNYVTFLYSKVHSPSFYFAVIPMFKNPKFIKYKMNPKSKVTLP